MGPSRDRAACGTEVECSIRETEPNTRQAHSCVYRKQDHHSRKQYKRPKPDGETTATQKAYMLERQKPEVRGTGLTDWKCNQQDCRVATRRMRGQKPGNEAGSGAKDTVRFVTSAGLPAARRAAAPAPSAA